MEMGRGTRTVSHDPSHGPQSAEPERNPIALTASTLSVLFPALYRSYIYFICLGTTRDATLCGPASVTARRALFN